MNYRKLIKIIRPRQLAALMKIPATTVYSWKKHGIPVWRITDIAAACEKNNIDISDCYESEE